MSSPVFTLQVPTATDYRALACEAVGRYLESIGESEAGRSSLSSALGEAIDRLVGSTPGNVEVTCQTTASGLEFTVRCGDRTAVVRHPLPAGKS